MASVADRPDSPEGRASAEGQQTSSVEVQTDLKRGLKMRHVNVFAIAGSIGSILIIYCILGSCVYTVMTAFAEMAIFAPMNKGFSGYATRFVDPALGFATGWNYFFGYSVLLANNLTATGLIMKY
ncbi:Amino-acid permease [Tolypocladium paradoxum]|uniref:Amino-acid permease n=1 Tax=Tolypocladium paradoxum TaxID=94208 RepID=A0A2S4KY69_9HYPO|nr:Amino-acid permease [Tolypocladium paradoxum]